MVAILTLGLQELPVQRKMSYPARPDPPLSVLAVQDRLIWEEEVEVAERLVGTVGGVASTVTVVVAVVVPLLLTAVKVYRVVVDRAGVVVLLPVTVPIVGLTDREVAPEVVQLKAEMPFKATTVGEAEKEEMVGGALSFNFNI